MTYAESTPPTADAFCPPVFGIASAVLQTLVGTNQNDRYSGNLAVGLVAYSADEVVQHVIATPFPLSLTRGQLEQVARNGIEINRKLAIDDATRNIRVVVFDRGSHETGFLTISNPRR